MVNIEQPKFDVLTWIEIHGSIECFLEMAEESESRTSKDEKKEIELLKIAKEQIMNYIRQAPDINIEETKNG